MGRHGFHWFGAGIFKPALDFLLPIPPVPAWPDSGPLSMIRVGYISSVVNKCLAQQRLLDGRLQTVAFLIGKTGIGATQPQIGDQAIIAKTAAVADDKTPFLYLVGRNSQPDIETFFEPAADDVANGIVASFI